MSAIRGQPWLSTIGNEAIQNNTEESATPIAPAKGWNVSTKNSSRKITWIYIGKTENGSIAQKETECNDILPSDKTKRNSPISLIAIPDGHNVLDQVLVAKKHWMRWFIPSSG